MKMKTVVLVMLLFLTLPGLPLFAQEHQVVVPYTLADRDRAMRTEVRMDAKFEAVNSRIDYLFWLQGVIVGLIMFILGYTIWDRRTQPALDKSSEAKAKSTNLMRVIAITL